jgi:hypothetical protein
MSLAITPVIDRFHARAMRAGCRTLATISTGRQLPFAGGLLKALDELEVHQPTGRVVDDAACIAVRDPRTTSAGSTR